MAGDCLFCPFALRQGISLDIPVGQSGKRQSGGGDCVVALFVFANAVLPANFLESCHGRTTGNLLPTIACPFAEKLVVDDDAGIDGVPDGFDEIDCVLFSTVVVVRTFLRFE